jgi:MFS family permease
MPPASDHGASPGPDDAPVSWRVVLRDRWIHASLGAFVYWVAIEALRPMVSLQLDRIGASSSQIGIAVAAYALLGLALAIPGGVVVDRVGPARLLLGGFLGLGACAGLYLVTAGSVVGLTVVQLAMGAAALAVWVALQTVVTHAGSGEFLRKQLAVFATAWAAGSAIGPVIGSWLYARSGFVAVAGLLVLGAGLGVIVAVRLPMAPSGRSTTGRGRSTGRQSAARLLGDETVRLVLAASFVSLAVQSLRTSFYPLYLVERGHSVDRVGVVLTGIGLASLGVRLLLPVVCRWVSGRMLLISTTWLGIVAMAATPVLAVGPWLAVGALGIGVSLGLNPPTTVELMAAAAPADLRGVAMGLRVAANRSAQVAQPLLFGAVVAATATGPAFWLTGGALGGLFVMLMYLPAPGRVGSGPSANV